MAWYFLKDGFFSAVQNQHCTANEVMVRARLREDIERLAAATNTPAESVMATPDADYAYRLKLSKHVWADYVYHAGLDIDYPNFKAACAKGARGHAYAQVWAAMYDLQEINR